MKTTRNRKSLLYSLLVAFIISLFCFMQIPKATASTTTVNVLGHGEISTQSQNATVTHGTYQQPNLLSANHTGVKLSGGTGAIFNLGTIDIAKSSWDGTFSGLTGSNSSSFIEFVYQPTNKDNFELKSTGKGELNSFTIKVSQGDKYFEIKPQYTANSLLSAMHFQAKADNQSTFGSYRSNMDFSSSICRKNVITANDCAKTGRGNTDQTMSTRGETAVAIPIYYDYTDNAIYTPLTGTANNALRQSYLIRDFDGSQPYNDGTTWTKFSKNGNGEVFVNVTITFNEVYNADYSSIVITKLGDNYLTTQQSAPQINTTLIAQVNNGEYSVLRNNEIVEITQENPLKLNDVIKFKTLNDSLTNLPLTDVRTLTINDKTYDNNTALNVLTKTTENSSVYYSYTVTQSDLENETLNVSISFDRLCKITVYDNASDNDVILKEQYLWAMVDEFQFPYPTASSSSLNTGSSDTDVLLGYARLDIAEKDDEGNFQLLRNDYNVYDVQCGVLYSSEYDLSHDVCQTITNENLKTAFAIVPDMTFKTVYCKIDINYEFKLTGGNTNTYSGLRFTVNFNKAQFENYLTYLPTSSNLNPFGEIHNYITTLSHLNKANDVQIGNNYDISTITANHWRLNGWAPNDTNVTNGLNLINGTNSSASDMQGKYGYVYKNISSGEELWNNDTSLNYYYAITLNNVNESIANNSYVFMPCITINHLNGLSTVMLTSAVTTTIKEQATIKFNKHVTVGDDGEQRKYVFYDINGQKYSSNYTATDIQWLVNLANLNITFQY